MLKAVSVSIVDHFVLSYENLLIFKAVLTCLLVVAAARPQDVLSIDQENHKHTQSGQAGTAVTGSYQ